MTIFPMIQPPEIETDEEMPLYKEVKWNYEKNVPVYKNGSPIIVEGNEAVMVWAWNALHTPRMHCEIYTWNYGNEMTSLIGQPYTEELKCSELTRHVKECLLINPYITAVEVSNIVFENDKVHFSCVIETIYGEGNLNV